MRLFQPLGPSQIRQNRRITVVDEVAVAQLSGVARKQDGRLGAEALVAGDAVGTREALGSLRQFCPKCRRPVRHGICRSSVDTTCRFWRILVVYMVRLSPVPRWCPAEHAGQRATPCFSSSLACSNADAMRPVGTATIPSPTSRIAIVNSRPTIVTRNVR